VSDNDGVNRVRTPFEDENVASVTQVRGGVVGVAIPEWHDSRNIRRADPARDHYVGSEGSLMFNELLPHDLIASRFGSGFYFGRPIFERSVDVPVSVKDVTSKVTGRDRAGSGSVLPDRQVAIGVLLLPQLRVRIQLLNFGVIEKGVRWPMRVSVVAIEAVRETRAAGVAVDFDASVGVAQDYSLEVD
jgi:hypothetical protein